MKSKSSFALTTLLFLSACAAGPASKSVPEAQAAAQSAGPNAVSIDASQSIQFPMTPAEKKKLNADFKKALVNEERALDKNEKTEIKTLTTDQNTKKKAWLAQEKKTRRAYFDQHMSGPERREYIQTYLKRKNEFEKAQKDELAAAKNSFKEKREYLKKFQKERSDQFKASMDQNKRPDSSLWPK